jgi:hypothetical protein
MIFLCSSSSDLSGIVYYASVIMLWLTFTEHPCNRWLRPSSVCHSNNPCPFCFFHTSKVSNNGSQKNSDNLSNTNPT